VVATKTQVLICGIWNDFGDRAGLLLRAYSAVSGQLQWEDHSAASPYPNIGIQIPELSWFRIDVATKLALTENLVLVVGKQVSLAGQRGQFLIRAHLLRNGALVWQDRSTETFFPFLYYSEGSGISDVTVQGQTVLAAGIKHTGNPATDLVPNFNFL